MPEEESEEAVFAVLRFGDNYVLGFHCLDRTFGIASYNAHLDRWTVSGPKKRGSADWEDHYNSRRAGG